MGMTIEEIKAYLKSMLSGYYNSTDTSNSNPKYRKIWVSENDAEALNTAIDIIRKYQKIVQIMERTQVQWREQAQWGIVANTSLYESIKEVLEDATN